MKDSPELTSRYELDRVLSWQGPTRTYQARDPVSGETVAVKAISLGTVPEGQVLKQRFLATAGILRTLDHPNLPRLLDFGVTSDAEAYLVFEWIEGATLDRLGDLAPRQVLPYVLQAIEGLETLALHGLVHLNLAPENLMVTNEGEIKLLGLGGSLFRVDWQSPLAQRGVGGGSGIAAPELQLHASAGSALWRADLYALAFVTCALLGAEVDGAGTASPEVRFPEEIGTQLHAPEQLAKALARCLHIEPSQRPVSYSNLGKVLQHSLPRAPRAESVVRDTQVFDVGELAARETPVAVPAVRGAGATSARGDLEEVSSEETRSEESTEIVALRSDLEASLEDGELKQPGDLGKEAEIYEGFLELRDDSAPVEIDLSSAREPRSDTASRGAAENGRQVEGNETILAPQVPSPVTAERPVAPPEAQTVPTRVAQAEDAKVPPALPPAPRPPAAPVESPAHSPTEQLAVPPPPIKEPTARRTTPPPAKAPVKDAAAPARRPASPPAPPSAGAATSVMPTAHLPSAPGTGRAAAPAGAAVSPAPRPAAPAKPAPPPKPLRSSRPVGAEAARPRTGSAGRAPADPAVPAPSPPRPSSVALKTMSSAAAAKKTRRSADLLTGIRGVTRGVASRPGGTDRRVLVAAGIVAFVAVSSLATVLLWPGGSAMPQPAVATKAEAPAPTPEPPLVDPEPAPPLELPEALQQAAALLDEGKLLEARDRLEEVAAMEEEGALDAPVVEAYRAVEEVLLRQRAESLVADLSAALKAGDPGRLRQTLAGITAAEEGSLSASSEGRQVLADARRARELLDVFQQSLAGGERMEALNSAFRLAESFPALDSALRSRERATAGVEAEVDTMIEQGRLEEAEERLVLLKSMWPDRPGIDGKLDTVHQRMESEARFDTLLAAAKAAGQRGRPHEGLRLLDGARPKREYVERFDRERAALEEQMRGLDAGAPVVRVKPGEIEYRKGAPVVVDLEAEDDYQVAGVTCWVRNASQTDYTAIEATRVDGDLYRVQIDVALHEDKTLRFWASVRDLSGHEGRLGSAEAPVEVKRKRWFR